MRASNAEPCSVCLVEIRDSGAGGVDVAEPEADAEGENDDKDDDYDDEVALQFLLEDAAPILVVLGLDVCGGLPSWRDDAEG